MESSSILIVEDENIAALNLHRKLNRLGFKVSGVAGSGEDAIQKARATRPKLVLMDIALKGPQDGVEAGRQIYAELDIPIVYLTALSDENTVGRARQSNPFGYLIKPCEERSLSAAIEIALYKHEMERRLKEEIETRRRAEEQLLSRTTELLRSNEELELFNHIVCHDLKEPVRMMSIYGQTIEKQLGKSISSTIREQLGFILRGADRMKSLLETLRSHAQVGGMKKFFELTDCGSACDKAAENLRATIQENKASVIRRHLPKVMGEPIQLVQLFQNLISNAIKFRGRNAPCIEIQAKQDGTNWLFSLKDNGVGFDSGEREKIFTGFRQEPMDQGAPLTGIGLAICKKVVEHHGGEIWLESTKGLGSTIFFTIPIQIVS